MAKSGLFCTHDAFQLSEGQSTAIVKNKAEKDDSAPVLRCFRGEQVHLAKGKSLLAPNTGPDFKIEMGGKVIWIEAICPGPGDGDNLIPQPEMRDLGDGVFGAVYSAPHEETLLRWTSAIANKTAVFERYLEKKIISKNDCCIIAVNASLLGRLPFTGISQRPFAVEATYAVGPLQVTINRQTGEQVDTSYVFRPVVKTVNGAPVDCDVFVDTPNQTPLISGVLGTLKKPGSCVGELVRQMVLVKNPYCTNPLPEDLKISNQVFSLQKEGGETYKINLQAVELETSRPPLQEL